MKKYLPYILLIIGILGVTAAFIYKKQFTESKAKLEVLEANYPTMVYINGQEVSTTLPYEDYFKPGTITLRLVPVGTDIPLSPWETQITLTEGVSTVVRREFGPTEKMSTGEILSFEKTGTKTPELAIISTPDAALIQVDGEEKDFTPLILNPITPTDHTLKVSHPGYLDREVKGIRPIAGYKLTAIIYLAEDPNFQKALIEEPQEATQSSEILGTTDQKESSLQMVKILETGTGFLRVRQDAGKNYPEIAQVTPGKEYPLLEENKDKTWLKIEYAKGKTGWISAEYTQKPTSPNPTL